MKPSLSYLARLRSLILVAAGAASILTSATVRAQETDWASIEIRTRPVAAGVYMLMGRGGNVGVSVGSDAVLALARPDTKIISGHGELAGPVEFQAYRDMLLRVRDRVSELKREGMSEDQVEAAAPTRALDAAVRAGRRAVCAGGVS